MPKVEVLDNADAVAKIDRAGMLGTIVSMPEMFLAAEKFSAGLMPVRPERIREVLVLGMGGSAIAGDIAGDLFARRATVPIISDRSYSVPNYVGPETFVFALSYSGETEEVLGAVREAGRRGAPVACITSGGKLKEIAESKKYPLVLIPTGYQPRAALPFLLVPLLIGLEKLGVVPPVTDEIRAAAALLQELKGEYAKEVPTRNNPAKQLAKKLIDRVPFILGATGTTGAAALRIKTQLNENAKQTGIVGLFPELNHNELVNIMALKRDAHNFALIVLRDEEDNERVKKRIEITKSLISKPLGGVNELVARGRLPLARIMSLIFMGDMVSAYLAVAQGTDPTPVEAIARLKKEMTR